MKTISTLSGSEAHDHCGAPLPDLPPRDVLDTAGDLLRALAATFEFCKPFPDEESLQKLPPGLSLVAADGFDPNIRVFRVTAS